MQAVYLENVSISWNAVTWKMEGWPCGYVAKHDPSLIHTYQERIECQPHEASGNLALPLCVSGLLLWGYCVLLECLCSESHV